MKAFQRSFNVKQIAQRMFKIGRNKAVLDAPAYLGPDNQAASFQACQVIRQVCFGHAEEVDELRGVLRAIEQSNQYRLAHWV